MSSARRQRRRRGHERDLPEKLDHFIPESPMLTAMMELEKKVDRHLTEKHLRIREVMGNLQPLKKTLRFTISHESHNQNSSIDDKENPPSWTMRIQGQFTDSHRAAGRLRFSYLFKSVNVLITELGSEPVTIPVKWDAVNSPVITDGFELKHIGNIDADCKILLKLNRVPEKYKIPKDLAILLGFNFETRWKILKSIFNYSLANKLYNRQTDEIVFDGALRQALGAKRVKKGDLASLLEDIILPLDPIIIDYKITLDNELPDNGKTYEIEIDIPEVHNPNNVRKMELSSRDCPTNQKELDSREEKIKALIQKYNVHRRRQQMLLAFAHNPEGITRELASQHSTYLSVGPGGENSEDPRKSAYYYNEWISDAVDTYLTKQGETSSSLEVPEYLDQMRDT
eukprot:CAMPEP_0114505034 /NCGR_PEP_ID=MMETSP0109-20121206/10623_1 /TAXON_ID=29199 /ORGANISM="Chlorarachnion reptans, Strain CCCM449" /LENGTH=397 /DNA_ID=CAMNT_0001683417 /DNA_START=46 /DNA_END=1239 /DNA_ORIENTATION=+